MLFYAKNKILIDIKYLSLKKNIIIKKKETLCEFY
jgi:hypothetical protein